MATDRNDGIRIITVAEAIRARPKMYVGSTDQDGLCLLVKNLIMEAIDGVAHHIWEQGSNFRASTVEVTLHAEGFVSVVDDGCGLPVELDPARFDESKKVSRAEKILRKLWVPARNGLAIANALSEQLNLKIFRDGCVWEQEYRAGEPTSELSKTGTTDQHGTSAHFLPDRTIFTTVNFDFELLAKELETMASKHTMLTIKLRDERSAVQQAMSF